MDWLEEARCIAEQCTTPELVATAIASWMATSAQCQRNADYYRGLVIECGEAIGHEAYVQDDGGVVDEVLCAKVPELVRKLVG